MPHDKMICIGSVGAPHGIRGHLRIRLFLENPESIHQYKRLFLEDDTPFIIEKLIRLDKGSAIVSVQSVRGRTGAETFKNMKLYIPRDAMPALEEGTFYYTDLIDLCVKASKDGPVLGKVKYVHDHGAGAILEIYDPETQESVLAPFRDEAVPYVSLSEGYLIVETSYLKGLND